MIFRELFWFEVTFQLRRPATWLFLLLLSGGLYLVLDEMINYAQTVEAIHIFSAYCIADLTGYANKFGLLMVAALVSQTAMRDINTRMYPLLYASSITKFNYIVARMLAVAGVSILLQMLSIMLVTLGAVYTVHDIDLGSFQLSNYINAITLLLIPNVLIQVSLFYAFILLFRFGLAAYFGVALVFLLGVFSVDFINSGLYQAGQLMDPSATSIIQLQSYSHTLPERNTLPIEVSQTLLGNRTLWLLLALLIGMIGIRKFRFQDHSQRKKLFPAFMRFRKQLSQHPTEVKQVQAEHRQGSFGRSWSFVVLIHLCRQYVVELMRAGFGILLLLFALGCTIAFPLILKGPFNVPLHLTTRHVTEALQHPVLVGIMVMLVAIAAGQLVWRERDCRVHSIIDATRVSNAQLMCSKLLALVVLITTALVVLTGAGVLSQWLQGYPKWDWALYGYTQLNRFTNYMIFAVLALFLHTIARNKYVGYILILVVYYYSVSPEMFGVENKLLIVASNTGLSPSDFFSQRFFIKPWLLFTMYWTGFSMLLLVITKASWWRGEELNFRKQLKAALGKKHMRFVWASGLILWLSTGTIIYFQMHVFNSYSTAKDRLNYRVSYEKQFNSFKHKPQPRLTHVNLKIELYPNQREATLKGHHQFINRSSQPVDEILISNSRELDVAEISFEPFASLIQRDDQTGCTVYRLAKPLAPYDTMHLTYALRYAPTLFSHAGISTRVMDNGTWVVLADWLPKAGYDATRELQHGTTRNAHGLPDVQEYLTETDKIDLDIVIGTTPGQVGVTTGRLVNSWHQNNRSYVRYKSKDVMIRLVDIYAAGYAVHESAWRDVPISIYYHPEHDVHITTFTKAATASLDYYTTHFGKFPFSELKLVEYTDSGIGGISLAGCIGYSSKFAMLHPAGMADGFNLPFAVMAHEIAHQWWGHRVVPARIAGGAFVSESLAWYSALAVIEQTVGEQELNRLLKAMRTSFLHPRTRANVPLLEANDQFLVRRKGPLALYALKEYLGAEPINQALRHLVTRSEANSLYQTTANDFYSALKSQAPDTLHYLIDDLLRFNTFWELETRQVDITKIDEGFEITLHVIANKLTVDVHNQKQEIPMQNDWVEVGIKADDNSFLYLRKHKITTGVNKITIRTKQRPATAGVDPRNLLMDTEPENNSKAWIKG